MEISNDNVNSHHQAHDVSDDLMLLDRMMADMEAAPDQFKPTHYWKFYEKRFLPELKRKGLKDFRRRSFTVLDSFGATDTSLKGYLSFNKPFRGHHRIAHVLNRLIDHLPFLSNGLTDSSGPGVTEFLHRHVKAKFEKAGLNLSQCPTSPLGNPEDLVEIEGGWWSSKHLNFCSIFADVATRIPMQDGMIVCELGPGLGRNTEIMAKLFPKATFILFDIPPQLYAANQYLRKLFGDRVISYEKAIAISTENPETALEAITGKICILPTWRMPHWSRCEIDLFFNSESFQEMEPDVVRNYLSLVQQMHPTHIYINSYPDGARWYKTAGLGGGQDSPVSSSYYFECLKKNYRLVEQYTTDKLLRGNDYCSYVFAAVEN